MYQMAQYYITRSLAQQDNHVAAAAQLEGPVSSDYDKLRHTLLTDDAADGWASELRRYLGTMQRDVTKDTDLVEWWQVVFDSFKLLSYSLLMLSRNMHSCIRHLPVSQLMYFLHRLPLSLASEFFRAASKSRPTVELLWDLLYLRNSSS